MTSSSGRWKTTTVLLDVSQERGRQNARWGEQNHPDGSGHWSYAELANGFRKYADEVAARGQLTWTDILREEVYEALAESDPVKLREELIQVAAVAVAWVEAIDRRTDDS